MPHRKGHVLADVHEGAGPEVEQTIKAAGKPGTTGRARRGRSAPRSFCAPPTSSPARGADHRRRDDAGPSKTCTRPRSTPPRAGRLLALQRPLHEAHLRGAALSAGVWNRLDTVRSKASSSRSRRSTSRRSAEPVGRPRVDGEHGRLEAASTAAYSAHFVMRILEEAGLPDGVIDLVYGHGAEIGDPALASPDLAGVHFTGSTGVFNAMWGTIGRNIDRYRGYPRIVGETGGKDFIVAHPTADADAVVTAVVRGSFEYQGQNSRPPPASTSRVALGRHARRARRPRLRAEGRRRHRFRELHGRGHRREGVRDPQAGARRGALERPHRRRRRHGRRRRGLLRPADRDRDLGSRRPAAPRGAVRADRHRVRLPRLEVGRDARARRLDLTRTASPAPSSRATARPSTMRPRSSSTPPATSTSTTSRPAPSSASSRSAAPAPRARTTRPARCGT